MMLFNGAPVAAVAAVAAPAAVTLLHQVIRRFYQDPEWVAAYDSSIPQTAADLAARTGDGSIWGGSEARRLVAKVPGILHYRNGA